MNSVNPVVFVLDDDEDVRRSLTRLLRAAGHVVEVFDSARDFLEHARPDTSGCLLLDVQMPALNGFDVQGELARRGIRIPIVFLTGHGDIPMAVQAVKEGAVDFLTKPYRREQLLEAIRLALEKDKARREASAQDQQVALRYGTLTSRERDVLVLVLAGLLNKQIAAELGNAERTVKVHRARVMQKMNVQSVAELARMVERSRLKLPTRPTSASPLGNS